MAHGVVSNPHNINTHHKYNSATFLLTIRCVWILLWTLWVFSCPHNVAAISMSAEKLQAIVVECQRLYRL